MLCTKDILFPICKISLLLREKSSVLVANAVILSSVDDERLQSMPRFGVRNCERACVDVDAQATLMHKLIGWMGELNSCRRGILGLPSPRTTERITCSVFNDAIAIARIPPGTRCEDCSRSRPIYCVADNRRGLNASLPKTVDTLLG